MYWKRIHIKKINKIYISFDLTFTYLIK